MHKNLLENLKGRDRFGDIVIDGRMTLNNIFKEARCEGVDWIHLAQDRVQWLALVNMVINLWVSS
jgi:hypothetical protein